MAHEQRRLAAIVSIDVVGYSRLMGRNESGTHALVKTHLAERVMPCFRRHGGRLVKSTGDGVLAEFGSAVGALSALIELQQEMGRANRGQPEADRIVFRAGVHLGEVIVEHDDIYGDAVNIAARLEGEAPPGGILASRAVREAVSGRIKAELHALGELSLKNIERPIRTFRVAWKEADWPTGTGAPSDLSSLQTGPSPRSALDDTPSIAVLPFRNLSGDPGRQYFADGVVEDVVTTLSRIPNLVVIPRNSSYLYKDRSVDVRQVGSELGASYVLDGSVRIAGSRLRIGCALLDAARGRQIWAERYDGAMADVFDLQDKITSSIVATIGSKVLSTEIARAQAKPTGNLSAYDLYLRAIAGINGRTESSLGQAVELLERAVAADRLFSSAYGYLACAHWIRRDNEWGPFEEATARGLAAAKTAIELGKDDPIALYLGGYGIAFLGGRFHDGLAHIECALALNPNQLGAWRLGGRVCWMMGDHEKSIRYYERCLQLSPQDELAIEALSGIGVPHFFLGHYDEALHWAERTLGVQPSHGQGLGLKILALAMAGSRPDELRYAVQQLPQRPTVAWVMERVPLSRSCDRELMEMALRKAGFPD
ncbi:MAG: adenylate/guanylate cyclase domain-containing protein [Rhodospirillales bacterium]|nr:adenylate/guanylate cyclase domain-containing protein [Rhodospirillales bacterium]